MNTTAMQTSSLGKSVGAANLRVPGAYWSPYLAGFVLGLVLLAAFVLMGHGIGASGAVASIVTAGEHAVAPAHAEANGYFGAYLADSDGSPLHSWIVVEVAGILIGGLLSGLLAGTFRFTIERGPGTGVGPRLAGAFGGGILMGFASRLARGCTSGQALTGGALLSVGSWAFMIAIFVSGYLIAPLMRRRWT
ncbi:MAG: YeeE/YedE thiosulfate transporter family protein [Gemmatimonadota bacterium]